MYSKIIILLIFSSSILAKDFFVTFHKEVKSSSIKREVIQSLFLGRSKYIDGINSPLQTAIFYKNKDEFKAIAEDLLNISPRAYESLWRKKLFSGTGVPPTKIDKKEILADFLKENLYGIVISTFEFKTPYKTIRLQQ